MLGWIGAPLFKTAVSLSRCYRCLYCRRRPIRVFGICFATLLYFVTPCVSRNRYSVVRLTSRSRAASRAVSCRATERVGDLAHIEFRWATGLGSVFSSEPATISGAGGGNRAYAMTLDHAELNGVSVPARCQARYRTNHARASGVTCDTPRRVVRFVRKCSTSSGCRRA